MEMHGNARLRSDLQGWKLAGRSAHGGYGFRIGESPFDPDYNAPRAE